MPIVFCLRNMEAGNGVVCSGWMPRAGLWSLGDRQAACWASKQGRTLGGPEELRFPVFGVLVSPAVSC